MNKKKTPSKKRPRTSKEWIQIIVALIGTLGLIIVAWIGILPILIDGDRKIPTPTSTIFVEFLLAPSPTPTKLVGKSPGEANPFIVSQYYLPNQRMGDIGDIQRIAGDAPNEFHFAYTTNGMGSHEWDHKCKDGQINADPARFAGVMLIDDATGIGGISSDGGYDLRKYKVIKWEAQSLNSDINVTFVFGGVTWAWGGASCKLENVPYPDSLPSITYGPVKLTTEPQELSFPIDNLSEEQLQHVVGVFGWTISWENNGVITLYDKNTNIIGPQNPKTFEIVIRNIRYEK